VPHRNISGMRIGSRIRPLRQSRLSRRAGRVGQTANMTIGSCGTGFGKVVCAIRGQLTSVADRGLLHGALYALFAANPPRTRRQNSGCTVFGGSVRACSQSRSATFPETPRGVLDRWRIDRNAEAVSM
jgi:hypothetical protein